MLENCGALQPGTPPVGKCTQQLLGKDHWICQILERPPKRNMHALHVSNSIPNLANLGHGFPKCPKKRFLLAIPNTSPHPPAPLKTSLGVKRFFLMRFPQLAKGAGWGHLGRWEQMYKF